MWRIIQDLLDGLYDYNQKSSSGELILRQPGQNSSLFDLAVITLYPSLYEMEETTRYPQDIHMPIFHTMT